MPEFITIEAPDNPEGTRYQLAPPHYAKAINRRFDGHRPVVVCPNSPDCYIYDPGNFWDGPTHVYYDGEGTFSFSGWSGPQRFPLIGPIQ